MNTTEVLKAARELISVPERWTQGKMSRMSNGEFALPKSILAVCWCAEGAVEKVSSKGDAVDAIIALQKGADGMRPFVINDTRTHAEVLAMFDRAIALSEQP